MSAPTAESIFKEKRNLRSKVRKALKGMDPVQRSRDDEAIQRIVLNAPWFKSSRGVCAYIIARSQYFQNTFGDVADTRQKLPGNFMFHG